MLIAASIVFMALENIVGRTLERRWLWAFGFGLVHGFGFSFQLRESLQFAGSHLYTSLLGFNIGVELGQLFALLFMVPALALLFGKVVAPRIGGIVVSALVAHTSWHWMTERWGVFLRLRLPAAHLGCGVLDHGHAVAAAAADRGGRGLGDGRGVSAADEAVWGCGRGWGRRCRRGGSGGGLGARPAQNT